MKKLAFFVLALVIAATSFHAAADGIPVRKAGKKVLVSTPETSPGNGSAEVAATPAAPVIPMSPEQRQVRDATEHMNGDILRGELPRPQAVGLPKPEENGVEGILSRVPTVVMPVFSTVF